MTNRKVLTEDVILFKSMPIEKSMDLVGPTDDLVDRRWDYMGYDFGLIKMDSGRYVALRGISILHVENNVPPDEHDTVLAVAIFSSGGSRITWDSPEQLRQAITAGQVKIMVV